MFVARRALTCPQFRPRATVLRPRLQAVMGNVRVLSTSPPPSEQPIPSTPPKTDVPEEVIYTGAHGPVIKTLKRVSLTTCVMGMISAPAFMSLGTEAVPGAATAALTGIVLLATCGPTFLLHAFTKSYIITLKASPRDQDGNMNFLAETCSFFSRSKLTSFSLQDVKPKPNAVRPFVTFEARDHLYFVHGETFKNKALLKRLVGRPLKPAEEEEVKSVEDSTEGTK